MEDAKHDKILMVFISPRLSVSSKQDKFSKIFKPVLINIIQYNLICKFIKTRIMTYDRNDFLKYFIRIDFHVKVDTSYHDSIQKLKKPVLFIMTFYKILSLRLRI